MIATLIKTEFKEIPLTNSDLFTLVDAEDYDYLMQWQWRVAKRQTPMVLRSHKNRHRYLHREIACLYQDYVSVVKHLNGNTLDNRRSNLKAILSPPRIAQKRQIIGSILDLSERELQTAKLVALGLKDKEIAEIRSVSLKTVQSHIHSINCTLGTNNRTEIAGLVLEYNKSIATESGTEYQPLPPIPKALKPIHLLKKQRLLRAQMIQATRDAIAGQIFQLQQIHADLEQTLKVMKP